MTDYLIYANDKLQRAKRKALRIKFYSLMEERRTHAD
jgi:hypothetical protein